MAKPPLLERIRGARMFQVGAVYLGASWVVLQITETIMGLLSLPAWVGPVAVLLMLVGLLVVLATAWVQSLPETTAAEAAGELPTDWEVDAAGVLQSLRQGRLPHLTWGRAMVGGVVALSLLFGFSGLYVLVRGPGSLIGPREAGAESAASGIAVLPFQVSGDDLDVYREGMVDLMAANLDGLSEYRAIDSRTVLARWTQAFGETADVELDDALRVAAGTGARYAVVGSGVEAGSQVRFNARIYDLSDGSPVGEGGQVQGAPDDVLALVDELTVEVMRSVLDATGQSTAQTFRLASLLTESVPALRHYLEGDAAFRRAQWPAARESLERAIEEDSTFALAYWRLGETLGWDGGIGSRESQAFKRRATELSDRLPAREASLLRMSSAVSAGRGGEVVGEVREYTGRYPDDPDGWYMLGEVGLHNWSSSTGVTDAEVEDAIYRAVDLDPRFAPFLVHPIEWASARGQEERFHEFMRALRELSPDVPDYLEPMALRWDLMWGDSAAHAAVVDAIGDMSPADAMLLDRDMLIGLADEPLSRLEPLARAAFPIGNGTPRWIVLYQQQGRVSELLEALEGDPSLIPWVAEALTPWGAPGIDGDPGLLALLEEPISDADLFSVPQVGIARAQIANLLGDAADAEASAAELDAMLDATLPQVATQIDTTGFREAIRAATETFGVVREGEFDAAFSRLSAALDAMAFPIGFEAQLGGLALAAERPDEAVEILEGATRAPDQRTHAKYLLGKAYEALGDHDRALDAYGTFLERTAAGDQDLPAIVLAKAAVERLGG